MIKFNQLNPEIPSEPETDYPNENILGGNFFGCFGSFMLKFSQQQS